ncbi:hypothetical protein DFH06DRAFT_1152650 [Mycena polygramma]|nr:hypothetical protein DFH06DRAFT_1152650 [Mycena polygramma]
MSEISPLTPMSVAQCNYNPFANKKPPSTGSKSVTMHPQLSVRRRRTALVTADEKVCGNPKAARYNRRSTILARQQKLVDLLVEHMPSTGLVIDGYLNVYPVPQLSDSIGELFSSASPSPILHLHGPPLRSLANTLRTLMDELWLPVARIAALRGAILVSTNLSPLKLAQKAAQTLWNELPLYAIADAHRKEAECLVARGNPGSTAINNAAVLVKYYKYLQLYPNKNSSEYVSQIPSERMIQSSNKNLKKAACARVHILERAIDGTAESGVVRVFLPFK